jgi:DNA-binding response OmpR family regulator
MSTIPGPRNLSRYQEIITVLIVTVRGVGYRFEDESL